MAKEAIPIATDIKVDNSTSDQYTIIDIFTRDRLGLLYHISRTIYEIGLNVHVARITTHLDQVVDVFYVTDEAGKKILDQQRLSIIKDRLTQALDDCS